MCACLMQMSMITRSCERMLATTSRSFCTKLSIMIAGSLSLRNASAIWSRSFGVFLSALPTLSADFWNLPYSVRSSSMRRVTSIGSGPVSPGPASSPSSASSSPTLTATSASAASRIGSGMSRPGTSMSAKPVSTSERRFLPSVCWSYSSISSWIDHGKLASEVWTWFRPSSMRLAIAISPSRVSSSTVPISRMYMRTGSVVRPTSASTADSTATASSVAVSSSVATGFSGSSVSPSGATSCTSMPMSLIMPMMSSICSGSTMSSGR